MTIAKIEALLRETMGLDGASIGPCSIDRAVRSRMIVCNETDTGDYWERIQASSTEAQELIEAVVVSETWFFRDRAAFAAMARFVVAEGAKTSKTLRLLSLPCATGEEPYSMAMVLLDSGLSGARFQIDAIDISARALRRAADASYGSNSFRGGDLGFRDRYFEPAHGRYRILSGVRERVAFMRASIFDQDFLSGAERYDVIFCRNMLIYFDAESQDRAVAVLARLLSPAGLLFVGPSETGLLRRNGFPSAAIPRSFAFRAPDTAFARARLDEAVKSLPAPRAKPPPRPLRAAVVAPALARPRPQAAAPPAMPPPGLEDSRRLADQGRFEESEQACAAHMEVHGASADGFCLLGLIRDAKNRLEDAARFYRKALYLEPEHHEALMHLTLLLERQGDARGAGLLNGRIARLGRKAAP
ncbi:MULTISPECIES: CheR family methyltransferase [Rhodomicrobium]|uniref:CheR family methyltransferase n=1 Tax=Rhodomicrobium TaxID=1068 RepID=UPI000B4A8ED6|nr:MULTISPECIES: CheR family methyltransferase [Rhodomicrobium]